MDDGYNDLMLREVTQGTADQDENTASRIQRRRGAKAKGRVTYPELRAVSQAMLTGMAARASNFSDDTASYATWGSWVEGVPFAHALMFNEGLIVDMIPCRTEADFVRTYRCLPRQFKDCLIRMQDSNREVFFNFRDYDPSNPDTAQRYRDQDDDVLKVYDVFEDMDFANCYLNSQRVKALLNLFDPDGVMDRHEADLGGTGPSARDTGLLRQLEDALGPGNQYIIRQSHPEAMVRGGAARMAQVPVPIQVFKRVCYHLAFSEICSDIPRDPVIDALTRRVRDGATLTFGELMDLAARANAEHHAYTAPLTGAYGGTYNLTETEAAPQFKPPPGADRDERNRGFLEFMYGAMSNRIREENGRLKVLRDVSGAISLTQRGQAPSDEELREYLDFLPESRSFPRKRGNLEHALRKSIRRGNGDLSDVDSYIHEAEKAYKNVNGLWTKLKRNVFVGGGLAAFDVVGLVAANLGLIDALFSSAVERAAPAGQKGADTVCGNIYDRFVDRRSDNKQVVRILDDLRG